MSQTGIIENLICGSWGIWNVPCDGIWYLCEGVDMNISFIIISFTKYDSKSLRWQCLLTCNKVSARYTETVKSNFCHHVVMQQINNLWICLWYKLNMYLHADLNVLLNNNLQDYDETFQSVEKQWSLANKGCARFNIIWVSFTNINHNLNNLISYNRLFFRFVFVVSKAPEQDNNV